MSVRVMSWVWEQVLPPNGKIVLLALADHAHDDGRNAFPSLARIAKKTGYSERQVQRILSELVRQRVISVQEVATTSRPTVYSVNIQGEFSVERVDFHVGSATRELRQALIERHGCVCAHCSRKGDEVCDPDGYPWEADRVQAGGEYSLENTLLSCRRCNRARGRGDILTPRDDTYVVQGDDTHVGDGTTLMSPKPSIEPSLEPPFDIDRHRFAINYFDQFWAVYPRKAAKQAAFAAFKKACQREDALTIIVGAKRYRDDPNREEAFTAHPATWLNQGRWEDEPLPARSGSGTRAYVEAAEALEASNPYLELGAAREPF